MAKANQSPRPVRSPARGQATPLVRATLRLGIAACDALAASGGVAERAAIARLLGALDVSLASAGTPGTDASGCRERYRELLAQTPDSAARSALITAWDEGRALPHAMAAVAAVNSIGAYVRTQAMSDAVPPPEPAGDALLTTREREVLQLLMHGLPDREIAARLSITEHTASTHVKRVRQKLGGGPRAEIVARILRSNGPSTPSNS
jgi:DNA-binding NarL/FixJ family response regulator